MTASARSGDVAAARFSESEPLAERLIHMFVGLATELAVTRERLDTLERLLAAQDVLARADVDAYQPDDAADAERKQWREEFLEQIFENLQAEIEAAEPRHQEES